MNAQALELENLYNQLLYYYIEARKLERDVIERKEIMMKIYNILPLLPKHPCTNLPYYTQECAKVIDKSIRYGEYNYAILMDVRNLKKIN